MQSTDKKVNEVTPELFACAATAGAMAALPVSQIEDLVRPVGLAPTKAKNLSRMSQILWDEHAGQVPDSYEGLEALPGVGHKSASVIMSQCFMQPAFAVDTHVHRLATRWGLTCGKSVEQTEADLKALFRGEDWSDSSLRIIFFGREQCLARHDPEGCAICSWAAIEPYDRMGASPQRAANKRKLIEVIPGIPGIH